MLKGQQGRNLDNQNILRKQRNPIHGNIYQLKLLMLFLYRGVSNQYSFQLGTEIEEAKKFDDLVFEYVENGEKKYRLLQAKHSWDGSKKITSADLFTEDDNAYSLVKYFFSYQDCKKEKLFKDSEVKVVVCTNINLDLDDSYKVNGTQTIKELVTEKDEKDNIIDLDTQRKSIKYGFKTDIAPLLHPLLESYNLTRLARSLVKFLLENKNIGHTGRDNIFKFYHIPLAKEVIDIKAKKLYDGFVKDAHTLSDNAKKFRKSFAEEIKKQSQGKLTIENINEAISNKEKVIENKEIGLNLSKKFGEGKDKNWPSNVIPKDEIEEFLNNLVFAVNQPNEEELGKIIKNEIGEDLDLVTTENTYNKFFITMLNWLQGKERGKFLTYAEGKEFFEEAKRGLPVLFNIKNPVNSFTGRIEQLDSLHKAMMNDGRAIVSQSVSISGLGGIGKSELARKYISQYSKDYDNKVIWINAESYGTLSESFRRLACDKLGISLKNRDGKEKDIKSIVEDVYRFFSKGKSLFVFDNAEKFKGDDGIYEFLPSLPKDMNKPHILVTSRNKKWPQSVKLLELNVFTPKEAIEFIKKALGIENNEQEEDIIKLAKMLQYFPLALQQAVAYIRVKDRQLRNEGKVFRISQYIEAYNNKAEELLNYLYDNCSPFPEDVDDNYTKTTFVALKLQLDDIEKRKGGNKAIEIMNILSYLAPDGIPVEIFSCLVSKEGELGSAIDLLKQYSMVGSGQEQTLLNIHRLVQQVIRINLKEQNKEEEVLEKALKLFKDSINADNVDHAISVWSHASKYDRLVKDFSELPSEITDKLNDAVRYKEACLFGEKALELLSNILGSDDKNTLNLKFNMAKVLYSQGKFDNALKTFEELESYEFDDSRNTLSIKHNRAVILSEKGYYAKALNILQDVLDKREKDFGSNDQETLQTKNSIAEVYQELGKNNKALSIFQEVLKQREETFGPNDQETLQTKNNIAVVHQKLGENNKALSIFQEVLKQREETFGFNHRETLQVKGSIAAVLENLGEYDDALKNYQEVLSEFKQILDDNNPDILKLENNIAGLFRKQGKYNDALEAYRKVLDKKTQSFDPNHPTILTTRNNMASVFDEQGDYDKALTIYNEILEENFDTFDRGELISTVQDNIEKASCRKNDKITPLHVAAANDSIERVKLLLKNGAIYNARTKQGKTPLDFAKSDELEKLLNIVKKLFENVKKGNNQQVTLCLEKEKAIVNSRDNDGGGTPLYWAIHNGHMNTARLLLENGADPTLVTNKGNTPLHIASSKGNNEIVRLLLENIKTDKLNNFINAQTTVGKTSALHIASNIEVTRSLLQYGAVYNIKNKEGKTPLDLAESDELKGLLNLVEKLFQGVKERNTEQVTDCLNKEKIVVNTRDSDGRTPLHWAVCNNDLESVQALLDRGADATLVTNKGSTSLHVAIAVKGSNELIEALLNHVKDTTPDKLNSFINAKKNDDTTAIDLAKSQGNREIIEILNQEALQEAPSGNMVDPSVAGPSRRYGSLPL